MGYDISTKFKSVEEVCHMLDFLKTIPEELHALSATEDAYFSMCFATGNDLGAYAPKKDRQLYISCHGTGIPYYAWSLFAWMAHKSDYRDKHGRPVLFYDSERCVLYDLDAPTNRLRIDKDGILVRSESINKMALIKKLMNIGPDFKNQQVIIERINVKYYAFLHGPIDTIAVTNI